MQKEFLVYDRERFEMWSKKYAGQEKARPAELVPVSPV